MMKRPGYGIAFAVITLLLFASRFGRTGDLGKRSHAFW